MIIDGYPGKFIFIFLGDCCVSGSIGFFNSHAISLGNYGQIVNKAIISHGIYLQSHALYNILALVF
jgi:hypothetical protein